MHLNLTHNYSNVLQMYVTGNRYLPLISLLTVVCSGCLSFDLISVTDSVAQLSDMSVHVLYVLKQKLNIHESYKTAQERNQ